MYIFFLSKNIFHLRLYIDTMWIGAITGMSGESCYFVQGKDMPFYSK